MCLVIFGIGGGETIKVLTGVLCGGLAVCKLSFFLCSAARWL